MIAPEIYFETFGPPISPPMTILLAMRTMKQVTEVMRNKNTE